MGRPKISSTSVFVFIHTMFYASTKCCRVQALIVCKLECVVPLANHKVLARVGIGQPLLSVRTHDKHKKDVIEALRRTKFKFPGRQKIYVSKKWGFTKWNRPDYEPMRADG